jgi:class 3 adenylate cyclase
VTETETRPRNRALVASFLFTDLVGYSKGTATDQYAAKATLSEILSKNLAALRKDDYRVKDTGDGALIAFLSNPEHALYMALAIAEDFERAARSAGFPSNSLRTGLHIGAVKEAIDLEARPNFVGDGINAAKRIMDFAAPGQITASRAYFEAVSWLDSAYAALFQHLGAPDDKHGRAHELYAIVPNTAVLEKLRLDLAPTARETSELDAKLTPPTSEKERSATAIPDGSPAVERRAVEGVRKWFVPIGALIAIAILVSHFLGVWSPGPIGVTARPVATEAGSPTPRTGIPVAPPTAEASPSRDPAPSPAASPKAAVATSIRAAQDTEGTTVPAVARPAPVLPSTPTSPGVDTKRRATETPPAPTAATTPSGQGSARCRHIIEKTALGESLSQDETRELANSCR